MSGTFASTIRENRFKIKLACLNMEWQNKDNEYVLQSLACVAGRFFLLWFTKKELQPRESWTEVETETIGEGWGEKNCLQSTPWDFEAPLWVLWKETWHVLRSDVSWQTVAPKIVYDQFPAHYLENNSVYWNWIVQLFHYQIKILNLFGVTNVDYRHIIVGQKQKFTGMDCWL